MPLFFDFSTISHNKKWREREEMSWNRRLNKIVQIWLLQKFNFTMKQQKKKEKEEICLSNHHHHKMIGRKPKNWIKRITLFLLLITSPNRRL
jgi:hypothetical protein